eukprot:jgi/Hompol1/5950/HPOL_001833-RA
MFGFWATPARLVSASAAARTAATATATATTATNTLSLATPLAAAVQQGSRSLFTALGSAAAGVRPATAVSAAATTTATSTLVPPHRCTPTCAHSLSQTRSYKIKTALKKRCEHCYFVRRKGKLRVVCPENGKHKQRQR